MNHTTPQPTAPETLGGLQPLPPQAFSGAADDPFRLGWRYVRRQLPDGTETFDQVPLTDEDVLYPEEGDHVVNEPPHFRDFTYCQAVLETFYADQTDVVVLGDCRVDWGVSGVRALGPDVLVIFDVREWRQEATYRFAEEGGRPILVLEVCSPSTRHHDLGIKRELYHTAGVERYVILDRGPQNEDPPRLLGYQRGPTTWHTLPPDAQGRLSLAPIPLLLGLEGDIPRIYDLATGQRMLNRTELTQALKQAETDRQNAERQLQAQAEAQATLEKRLRELEDQLRGKQNPP